MPFTGKEGEEITLELAKNCTANFRKTLSDPDTGTKGHFFGKEILQKILDQPGCKGIRIYYGLEENADERIGKMDKVLVLVGADAQQNDIVDGVLADRSVKCPPTCGDNNALNS